MSKEVGVKSITIKVGSREICLDVAEAKKLRESLEDLFGKEVIREIRVERWRDPVWRWQGPVWVSGGTSGDNVFETTWGKVQCYSSGHLSMEVK